MVKLVKATFWLWMHKKMHDENSGMQNWVEKVAAFQLFHLDVNANSEIGFQLSTGKTILACKLHSFSIHSSTCWGRKLIEMQLFFSSASSLAFTSRARITNGRFPLGIQTGNRLEFNSFSNVFCFITDTLHQPHLSFFFHVESCRVKFLKHSARNCVHLSNSKWFSLINKVCCHV